MKTKKFSITLTTKEARILWEMASQMTDDIGHDPVSCGYTRDDANRFANVMDKLRSAIQRRESKP